MEPVNEHPDLLRIEDLTLDVRQRHGDVRLLSNISFALPAQERLGITGHSGSGKTVTCLALLGLLPNANVSGRFSFCGQPFQPQVRESITPIRGRGIAMLFQNASSALNPFLTVSSQLLHLQRLHQASVHENISVWAPKLLGEVGIPDVSATLGKYPHQLSGGMAQRVLLAMALLCNPKVLIADEPTASLDSVNQVRILDLLLRVTSERHMGLILVSHDFRILRELTEQTVVLHQGTVVESGPTAVVTTTPSSPVAQELMRAANRLTKQL